MSAREATGTTQSVEVPRRLRRRHDVTERIAPVATPTGDDLTTIELLVLYEAGGDNDLGNAYGAVQLYAVFEQEEELLDVTQSALLRLFDLGLVRFVEAPADVGYTARR